MAIAQVSSISAVGKDPLRDFKFNVVIQQNGTPAPPAINMGFMSVSGLGVTCEVISYRGGGMNVSTQNMPGQLDYNPIVLTRGVTLGATQPQITWLQQLYGIIQGTGPTNSATGQSTITKTSDFRASVTVSVLGHPSTGPTAPEDAGFVLYNAWPTIFSYSALDAGSNQLFIYQMSFIYEGFDAYVSTTSSGMQTAVVADVGPQTGLNIHTGNPALS